MTDTYAGLTIEAALQGGYVVTDVPPYDGRTGDCYAMRRTVYAGRLEDCLDFIKSAILKHGVGVETKNDLIKTGPVLVSPTSMMVADDQNWGGGGGNTKKVRF